MQYLEFISIHKLSTVIPGHRAAARPGSITPGLNERMAMKVIYGDEGHLWRWGVIYGDGVIYRDEVIYGDEGHLWR
jgi:hypothetical protein